MFILQISTGAPINVMPRRGGYTPTRGGAADPWGPTIHHIRQRHGTDLRGISRNQTIVGRTMKALLGKDCTYNEDGSYSRPDDTGRYHYQPDGSIFYSGGTITTNTSVVRKGPMTLRNPSNPASNWDESNRGSTILAGTHNFNKLDLIPDGNGGFTKPGEGNTGRYLLQPDGSIFYEGGQLGGNPARAQTYNNGSWDTTKNTPMAGTNLIQSLRLTPAYSSTPRVFEHPHGSNPSYYVYMLSDGKLLYLKRKPTTSGGNEYEVEIYENGSWTKGLTTNSPRVTGSTDIQAGIRAIQSARTLYWGRPNLP
ncbi:MAG: hypothetical protein HYZ79_06055 [Candidatus Melainabacteria bacterium]|nr:hypothetical protein [Candidatus Melainabacteria bacterium]